MESQSTRAAERDFSQAERHSQAYPEVQWYADAHSTIESEAVTESLTGSQETEKAEEADSVERPHNHAWIHATEHLPLESVNPGSAYVVTEEVNKETGHHPRGDASSSYGQSVVSSGSVGDHDAVMQDVEKAEEPGEKERPDEQPSSSDPNLIGWNGPEDPENPFNWPISKKCIVTGALASMTLVITFTSSVFSTATIVVAQEYGVSDEVTILGTSLFVLGFAVGPIIWGPMSELYGRKRPLFLGFAVMGIFQIPVGVAQNLYTILICRFIAGAFGSAPLAIVGGALADFWDPVDRGVAIVVFAAATFIGPVAGPIVGGFITQSYLGWRWTAWITLIMVAFSGGMALIFVKETYAPVLLSRRAAKIRFETKNWAIHAKADERKIDFREILVKFLFRPFQMLILEPILVLLTIYMALIYGILYLFFESYPVSFQVERGWNDGVGALPFLGITVGVIVGGGVISWLTVTRFARKLKKHGKVVPEERLPPMIIGAIFLPVGLFWFGWTSSPHITWVPEVLAGIPIGAGVLMIFIQGLNYIIDCYLINANSAIAANTFVRSFFGAGFPLFATQMFTNLGVAWASSLLGFLTVVMIPIPILFYIYGKKIRAMSRYSPTGN